jgi:8-oxo-dGTP pyrophosphatase MutT (NUDIX family)
MNSSQTILEFLALIPEYRESPKPIEEIIATVVQHTGALPELVEKEISSTIIFLNLFDVLDESDGCYKIKSRIPSYFIRSLTWYIKYDQPILSNWDRLGVARTVSTEDVVDKAPYFLKSMEKARLLLSQQKNIDSGFSRSQSAALIFIKATKLNKTYFLHQWDERAQHFQLIGGKVRENELNIEAAKRELQEEISQHDLVCQRDYDIFCLGSSDEPIKYLEVSRTYGALTEYKFWLYTVRFKIARLNLSHQDRWISTDEMRQGLTKDKKKIFNSDLYRIFESSIAGGYESIQVSIKGAQIGENIWNTIEIKPSLFGLISIDLKALFSNLFKR